MTTNARESRGTDRPVRDGRPVHRGYLRGYLRRAPAVLRLALAIGLANAWAPPAACGAGDPPRLIVQAPPELAAAAAEIRSYGAATYRPALERTGLSEAGGPITVVLVPESAPAARRTPRWVAGSTDGGSGVIALFPARVDGYPDRGLEALLQHELAHVLVARAARGQPVPRWFDEGLAMAAGRVWGLGDRARVALAVLTDDRLPLARIDAAFAGGSAEVESAYALAGDFFQELERRFGAGVGAAILDGVARGAPFKPAFLAATGQSLAAVETAYWRRRSFWNRWVPIVTSSAALWGGITLLALAAFRRRRAIDAEIHRRWTEELPEPTADSAGEGAEVEAERPGGNGGEAAPH